MSKLSDIGAKLSFDDVDLTPPIEIIKTLISQLSIETRDIVSGVVEPYSGRIFSTASTLATLSKTISQISLSNDIQETLGYENTDTYKYVFYLQTPAYEKYKYRVCYLQHGIGQYPVTLVLEQSIADEIFSKINAPYIVQCNSRNEFEDFLVKIVYTKRILSIMQEMIQINQIKKQYPQILIEAEHLKCNNDGSDSNIVS